MELIERYVYAVTSRLPVKQRQEVGKELESLIDDMLTSRCGAEKPGQNDLEGVLMELGEPSVLADRYRNSKRYLVGPENFDTYILLIKIVGFAVTLGLTIALVISYIINPPQSVFMALGDYISTILSALAGVFAWLTVVFALFDYYGIKTSEMIKEENWKPAKLPQVPAKLAIIKPLEPIFGIVFIVLFIILINAAAQLIGIYSFDNDIVKILPLLNLEIFNSYLPYFNVLLILAIGKEAIKLIIGKWTLSLAGLNILLNVLSLIAIIAAFTNPDIWGEAFLAYLQNADIVSERNLEQIINNGARGLLGIITIIVIIDSFSSLFRGLKHKTAGYL